MSASNPMSFSYQQGTPVHTSGGRLGTLEDVIMEPGSDVARALRVQRQSDGATIDVPVAYIDTATSNDDEIVLRRDYDTLSDEPVVTQAPDQPANADELVIPVREEALTPQTHETHLGRVIVHKRVENVPVSTTVELERDQVAVERVEINQTIDTVPGPRQEGDTLIIPVVEEVLVTEKRLMLREEIRITRQRLTEAVAVDDTLQREVVEFEERRDGTMADALGPVHDQSKPSASG
jgi:uncharacterized protein (TIGR02271 family)